MKLVFSRSEVAAALGLSDGDFESRLGHLAAQGFPLPIPGLEDHWAIMDVMSWVNREKRPALPEAAALERPTGLRH